MIFKKPYAFLIKYFKLINLIISLLVMYITYRTYNIISFFSSRYLQYGLFCGILYIIMYYGVSVA